MKTILLTLVAAGASAAAENALPQIALAADASTGAIIQVQLPAGAKLVDGTYTGPIVDAYFGPLQVQAVVQSGRIVSMKMLKYPSDRRESLSISQNALPRLRDEVVRIQSTKVDIISGATLTSQAFVRSLDGALTQARPAAL